MLLTVITAAEILMPTLLKHIPQMTNILDLQLNILKDKTYFASVTILCCTIEIRLLTCNPYCCLGIKQTFQKQY